MAIVVRFVEAVIATKAKDCVGDQPTIAVVD